MDAISKARALIAPLKDFTPGPWRLHGRIIVVDGACDTYSGPVPGSIGRASDTHDEDAEGSRWWTRGNPEKNAAMFAAAPALRDTVAALTDLADAQAQENAELRRMLKSTVCYGCNRRIGDKQWLGFICVSCKSKREFLSRAALGEAP